MRWTIGMPSYNNYLEVFFTVQSLQMHHNLKDCEIIVIDNYGDDNLFKFIKKHGGNTVKYEKHTEVAGVSYAKNKIFEHAKGENVLVMDSHVLLKTGALDIKIDNDDLYQGPLKHSCHNKYSCEWLEQWRGEMWGIWAQTVETLPEKPFEIWAMGAGFFACKKDSWLGFNEHFRGFGGETGYLQEKYRMAGRKVWCHPALVWLHMFYCQGREIPYSLQLNDRIRNYILGFIELGLDLKQIEKEYGKPIYDIIFNTIKPKELANMKEYEFIQEHVFTGGVIKKVGDKITLDQNLANVLMSHRLIKPIGPEYAIKEPTENADSNGGDKSLKPQKPPKPDTTKKNFNDKKETAKKKKAEKKTDKKKVVKKKK